MSTIDVRFHAQGGQVWWGVPQEVGVLLNARDAKGAALAAGGDGQVIVLHKESQTILCGCTSRVGADQQSDETSRALQLSEQRG